MNKYTQFMCAHVVGGRYHERVTMCAHTPT